MKELTHLSLFTGIGGIDLAAEWAGFETVGQCEWADYPTKVLEKHFPGVERWRDIRTLTQEDFYARTGRQTVDLVSGGFPCQPFSVAGKRKGEGDDRYLWPEMLRVIREIHPTWVLGENVAGIINMALDKVLSDLESIGYKTQAFIIPACGVDAPHRRYRVFIVGYAEHDGSSSAALARGLGETRNNKSKGKNVPGESPRASRRDNDAVMADTTGARIGGLPVQSRESRQTGFDTIRSSENVSDSANILSQAGFDSDKERLAGFADSGSISNSDDAGLQVAGYESGVKTISEELGAEHGSWWAIEPDVGRVAHGVPARVDRLKCLGNAVVPQQVYPILQAISQIEMDFDN